MRDLISNRRKPNAIDWMIRGSICLVYLNLGWEKIAGAGWVEMFAAIGFGQWFRYFTGAVQMVGGGLLLIPRTAKLGTALLASTMIGAILVHLFVLRTGGAAIVPALLLGVVALGWAERGEPEEGRRHWLG